jgi:hypothetical protein
MFKDKLFRRKLHKSMVEAGISGPILAHDENGNRQAIARMIKLDPYFTFGIHAVEEAIKAGLSHDRVNKVMADALGISGERFGQEGASYISPDRTVERCGEMLKAVDETIAARQHIMLATGHPGSLLEFYLTLGQYIDRNGGRLFRLKDSIKISSNYWVDSVSGVVMVSDLGTLLHTHDFEPMRLAIKESENVGLVVADHGFAGAAINAGIKTVGLHDVDDPAIPVAACLGKDVIAVPMNDNQLNVSTNRALDALMAARQVA